MRHIFIINPKAGQGGSVQRIQTLAEQLGQRHHIETLTLLTHGPGHATTLARSLAETGEALRLYACGGDGTINEVANGIAGFRQRRHDRHPHWAGQRLSKELRRRR